MLRGTTTRRPYSNFSICSHTVRIYIVYHFNFNVSNESRMYDPYTLVNMIMTGRGSKDRHSHSPTFPQSPSLNFQVTTSDGSCSEDQNSSSLICLLAAIAAKLLQFAYFSRNFPCCNAVFSIFNSHIPSNLRCADIDQLKG